MAYAHFVIAGAVAVAPLAAVRIWQGLPAAPPAGRALAAVGLVAVLSTATWLLWAFGW